MTIDADIVLSGGGSRVAALLAEKLGDQARCITRRPTGHPGDLMVDDYEAIPLEWFAGRRCVVQCIGTSSGTQATLDRVNVDIPLAIGRAARAAGAQHIIHISSFSVYGRARAIHATTAPAPVSDYGRSKLRAENALLALANDDFQVTILRLPLVYGGRSKLQQLVRLWSRVRVMPVPAADVRRAMIGVDLSAEVILQLIDRPCTGILSAADPRPFTYADAARARPERLYRLPLPPALTKLVERFAPQVGDRMFADSTLADADNIAVTLGLPSRLYRDIAAVDLS